MDLIAYLLIGYGIGYMTTSAVTKGPDTKLDYMKHDLEVRKEWFRMLARQKRKESKWPEGWN